MSAFDKFKSMAAVSVEDPDNVDPDDVAAVAAPLQTTGPAAEVVAPATQGVASGTIGLAPAAIFVGSIGGPTRQPTCGQPMQQKGLSLAERLRASAAPGHPPTVPGALAQELPTLLATMRKKATEAEDVQWYFPGGTHAAFVDMGSSLIFSGNAKAPLPDRAIEAGLLLALNRGWVPPHIEGTDPFLKAAFAEACRLGIYVTGYTPSPEEVAEIKQMGFDIPSAPPEPAAISTPASGI